MQHGPRKAPPSCLVHEKFEDSLPDASAAQFREYRHSSDFYFDPAMDDKSAAPDRTAIQQGEGVNCMLIVLVALELLGNMLLFDEDAPPDGVGVGHFLRRFDRDDAGDASHVMLLARHSRHRQIGCGDSWRTC